MRFRLLLGIAALAAGAACGHDFWLDAEPLRPEAGASVTVWIRGGHYFPESAIALADRLIAALTVESPGGAAQPLTTAMENKERRGAFVADAARLHRLSLVIQQPRQPVPAAWAHAYVVPRGADTDPATYAAGTGLEIVPRTRLETIAANQPAMFEVLRNGQPVAARIEFVAAAGGTGWASAKPEQPAEYVPRKPGRHLAMVADGGQTATLVFEVAP